MSKKQPVPTAAYGNQIEQQKPILSARMRAVIQSDVARKEANAVMKVEPIYANELKEITDGGQMIGLKETSRQAAAGDRAAQANIDRAKVRCLKRDTSYIVKNV